MPPNAATAPSMSASDVVVARDVGLDRDRFAAAAADAVDDRGHRRVIGMAIDHDFCAEGRKTLGDRPPDVSARAGDDGNLAIEPKTVRRDHEWVPAVQLSAILRALSA